MKTSKKGLLEIAQYEGLCVKPYYDSVGVITIGIGATRTEFPDLANWDKTKEMSIEECCHLFQQHVIRYENTVLGSLTRDIEQWQFDALVSLCYNIGQSGLVRSTLIKRVNSNAMFDEIGRAFMMWNKPPEIVGRRTKEKNLYVRGVYTSNGKVLVTTTDGRGHELQRSGHEVDISGYFT